MPVLDRPQATAGCVRAGLTAVRLDLVRLRRTGAVGVDVDAERLVVPVLSSNLSEKDPEWRESHRRQLRRLLVNVLV